MDPVAAAANSGANPRADASADGGADASADSTTNSNTVAYARADGDARTRDPNAGGANANDRAPVILGVNGGRCYTRFRPL